MTDRLFDDGTAESTIKMNGERVSYRGTTLSANPEDVKPGETIEEVILRWPDGSAFKMQFYAAPAWWDGKSEGRAVEFYLAVHDLLQERTDEDDPMSDRPRRLIMSKEEGSVLTNEAGERVRESPQAVLRFLADMIEDGILQ